EMGGKFHEDRRTGRTSSQFGRSTPGTIRCWGTRWWATGEWRSKENQEACFRTRNDGDGMPVLDITETKLRRRDSHRQSISHIALSYLFWVVKAVCHGAPSYKVRMTCGKNISSGRCDLKEPSKLQHWDTTALLNFCMLGRRKAKVQNSCSKHGGTEMGTCDPEANHESDPESNPEDNTHHMKEDADDDTEEGRSPQKETQNRAWSFDST
ncbi:hypothetical protein DFJ58DRAFT_848069, partial [Suillus subalutaceus]|uniref:uncharacterized protein n=1 Tax=Suillus subalutaceus TaxID=48586 RepID=UPI001B88264E